MFMKKFITLLSLAGALLAGSSTYAQSIDVQHDTVTISGAGFHEASNYLINTTTSAVTVEWKVIATNFPSDWIANTGICDNNTCISGAGLWPAGTLYETVPYAASTTNGMFKMQIDLATASGTTTPGTHFLRVRLNNKFAPSDTAIQTYIVTKTTTSVKVVKSVGDITMYPNPATSALNLVFDANADIKNIAIYNIIGKQVNMFRVGGSTSASLNVENLSDGIYFVRLMNSNGEVVATRKFTKQ